MWSVSKNFVYMFPVSVTVGGVSQPISHCQNDNHIIIDRSMAIHSVLGGHRCTGWCAKITVGSKEQRPYYRDCRNACAAIQN
jgi:hypothetical protein